MGQIIDDGPDFSRAQGVALDLCAHCFEAFWRRCGGDSNQITGRLGETTERWFSEPEIVRTDEIIVIRDEQGC